MGARRRRGVAAALDCRRADLPGGRGRRRGWCDRVRPERWSSRPRRGRCSSTRCGRWLSAGLSRDPAVSVPDTKQLVLFLLVPVVFTFARGPRARTAGHRRPDRRRRQRLHRRRAIRPAQLRQPGTPAAGHALALDDLLGHADAGDLRQRGAAALRSARPGLGGAGDAGAGRRARPHLHPQRLGRRVRRRRRAVPAEGPPADRRAAAGRGRARGAGAGGDHQPGLLDVRHERSHQPRSRGDARGRPRHRPRPSADRCGPGHGPPGLPALPGAVGGRADQRAPPQRAGADRRRARPAGAGGLGLVHRRGLARPVAQPAAHAHAGPGRRRPGIGGGDAGRRPVRIQLRRLGVPDALPGVRHAAAAPPIGTAGCRDPG